MSNFGEIKAAVLGCATRLSSSFQSGNVNLLNVAINNALIHAQRQKDFEWCKGVVSVECRPKGSLMAGVDSSGNTVKIKRIIKAFGAVEPTGHLDKSVPYLSRVNRISDVTGLSNKAGLTPCVPAVLHDGQDVYLTPDPGSGYKLWFYAVKWLPKWVNDRDTNFFLEYGFDYIMYRALVELNFYLKEEERFPVNKAILSEAWTGLSNWDDSLLSPTETEIDL